MLFGDRKPDMTVSPRTCVVLLLVVALVFPPGIFADYISWTPGDDSGLYSDTNNWICAGCGPAYPNNGIPSGATYDATISNLGAVVALDTTGVVVNSMTVYGTGSPGTASLSTNGYSITFGSPTSNSGNVLNVANGGVLNVGSGSTAIINLASPGTTATNDLGSQINVTDGGTLTIQNPNSGPTIITNNGNISVVGTSSAAVVSLDDGGTHSTFTLTGSGTLTLGGFGQINGTHGDESLINDVGHTIAGDGVISGVNFTNNGTLNASTNGATLLVQPNLTNWTASSGTLTGGAYTVADGASLQLSSIGAGNFIQSLAGGAAVNVTGAGLITGDGNTNSLGGLTNITDSSLYLTNVGSSSPLQITPGGSPATLTLSATSAGVPNIAALTLDGESNVQVNGAFTNSVSTIGGSGPNSSNLTITNGSTLTTGAFLNQSQVDGNLFTANANVNVQNGATLTVDSLTTSTNNLNANSNISVNGGFLNVTNDVLQGGTGANLSLGNDTLSLTNGSVTMVGGNFANNNGLSASAVNLDNSSLTVTGSFTQSQASGNYGVSQLNLTDNSVMSVGGMLNEGGINGNGTYTSQVSITGGSALYVTGPSGSFQNVTSGGTLSGGSYFIGTDSSLNYTGANINTIDLNTSLTLDNSGQDFQGTILNGGSDALSSSLTNVNGTLVLQNGASLILPQTALGVGQGALISITDNSNLTLQSYTGGQTTITNDSNISIVGTSSPATLTLDDGGTASSGSSFLLTGNGTLTLGGQGQITGNSGDELLYNDVFHTIAGSGLIQNLTLDNNGTVIASGGNLVIDTTATGVLNNNGTMNVVGASTLTIQDSSGEGTTVNNNGFINLNDALQQPSQSGLLVSNTHEQLGPSGPSLVFNDNGTFNTFMIAGTGAINMNSASSSIMGGYGDETLVNSGTIQGTGTISNLSLVNYGTITANGGTTGTGGNLVLDVSSTYLYSSDGNSLVTNNGNMNVTDGSTLTIRDGSESSITNVVNNGNINLNSAGGATSLVFDSEGATEQFILTGQGVLNMTNSANNSIQGAIYQGTANESLVNDFYHTIQGTGTISNFFSFTNIGTLQASNSGGTLLVDTTANLTNWDGVGTLTNGAYVVNNGAILQLSALGGSTIQNLVGADVAIYGTGLLTGTDGQNAASGISSIYSGTGVLGEASLTLGWIHSPVTLATDSNGAFTVTSDDNNNFGAGSASLELEHTTATLAGDLYNTATTSNFGAAHSGIILDHHASLTVNSLFNNATTTNPGEIADAEVNLSRGSHLTVQNNLSNVATDNSGSVAYSQASVNLDGHSKLTVLGTYTNDSANQTGFASLNLTNNSTATVTGLFTNTGSSTVALDELGTGGSTLTTNGGFLNSNSGVLVLNNSTLTSTHGFTNSADDSIPSALAGYSLLLIGPNIPLPPFGENLGSGALKSSTTGWDIGNPPVVSPSTGTITGGLVNTASTSNNLYSVYSVIAVNGGSTLTADSLTNSATTNTPDGIWGAFAEVNVTGQSFLNVTGNLINGSYNPIPSSGDGSFGQSVATINVDGGSSLTVGTGVSNYNSQIFLTNSSTMLVSAGGLTNSSDDNNWITYGNGILSLDASTGTITGGLQNTASTSNGGLAVSTVSLNNGAGLTVDSLSNTATVSSTLSPDSATANVTVSGGSTLTVTGNVSNTATFNPGALGFPAASISVDGSTLSVGGTFNNTSASLSLTNTSTATVTGLFTNDSGSTVTLDFTKFKGEPPPGSTLTTSDGFNNNGAVNLNYSSALNNTGRFSNVGSLNLNSGSTLTNSGTFSNSGTVSTGGSASNSINVTGAIFNTSAGTVNLNVAGDQMTSTSQFKNWGMVNLNGNGASVSTNTALTSIQGFYNGTGGVVTLAAVGAPPEPEENTQVTVTGVRSVAFAGNSFTSNGDTKNDGTIAFTGAYGTFTSTGDFNNRVNGIVTMAGTGDVLSTQGNMSNAGTVTIGDGEGVTVTGGIGYTQTAGTTTIDSTGTLTAALVDIAGGVLEGTVNGIGTIAGNLKVDNNGTLNLGDPQSIDVTGNYDQVDGSTLDIFLGDAGLPNYDQVDVTGNVTIEGGTLDLTFAPDFFSQPDIEAGTVFDIINSSTGTVSGDLLAFNNQTWDNGTLTFQEVINGNQLDLDVVDAGLSATPEPSTLSMLFCAMLLGGGITWRIRRRRTAAVQ